jgi:flavin-dependent dehydrogenase
VLAPNDGYQPPDAPLSRALEVHPPDASEDLAVWIDRRIVPAGGAWCFPADGELRIGVGSFDPHFHVKDCTMDLAEEVSPSESEPRHSFKGNWIPHRLRPAAEDGVFFVGDSAGHCLPLTAEGIRTAFYFGIACGRELREAIAGTRSPEEALRRYGKFSDSHAWMYRWMLRAQRAVPHLWPRALTAGISTLRYPPLTRFAFNQYLSIAPPEFAAKAPNSRRSRVKVPQHV